MRGVRRRRDALQERLRNDRPEPRDDFVLGLAWRIEKERQPPEVRVAVEDDLRRFWGQPDELEGLLLDSRAEPSAEFVQSITKRARRRRRPLAARTALAAGLTTIVFGLLGAFGGLGYAKKAVEQAIGTGKPAAHEANGNGRPANQERSGNGNADTGGASVATGAPTQKAGGEAERAAKESVPADAPAPSQYVYAGKVTICHRTHSRKNPFVLITVSRHALPAHKAHGDSFPGPGGTCPGSPIP
jgi:hypothetical protein